MGSGTTDSLQRNCFSQPGEINEMDQGFSLSFLSKHFTTHSHVPRQTPCFWHAPVNWSSFCHGSNWVTSCVNGRLEHETKTRKLPEAQFQRTQQNFSLVWHKINKLIWILFFLFYFFAWRQKRNLNPAPNYLKILNFPQVRITCTAAEITELCVTSKRIFSFDQENPASGGRSLFGFSVVFIVFPNSYFWTAPHKQELGEPRQWNWTSALFTFNYCSLCVSVMSKVRRPVYSHKDSLYYKSQKNTFRWAFNFRDSSLRIQTPVLKHFRFVGSCPDTHARAPPAGSAHLYTRLGIQELVSEALTLA